MSKKLWQAIGVWNTHSPHSQQQETPNNSSNPPDSNVEIVIAASSCDAGDVLEKREQLSLEIESCQSQQMRSDASHQQLFRPSNGEIAWCQSNLFVEKAFKIRIRQLALQAKDLQKELRGIQNTVQREHKSIGRDLLAILNTFSQQFNKRSEDKPVVTTCQRCDQSKALIDQSKALIDQLTRQCWQSDAKLQEEREKAEQKLMKEDHPMKKIENSWLQERGQAMKRLKSQVQELRQENEGLYMQLSEKEQLLQQMETQYKKSLLAFKTQIEVIGQACTRKIEQIIQEKTAIQAELQLLRGKHSALQEANQLQQIRRNADKRYFTQHLQTPNFPSATDLQNPFNKQPPNRQVQTPHARNISSRDTASLIDLDLSQLDSFSTVLPVSHAHIRRQPYLQAPKKNHLFFEAPSLSRTSLKSSQMSLGNALQRLSQLQKGVRKEINRSKKSIK